MPPSKDNEFSLSPEIDRLSSQLAKDPKSKLFMPLAEEYIKSGMAEEAIMTLEEGLKVHPAYMSARVLLGKAFLEKNDLDNARAQFEMVVKAIPDNLFAHKKLGEVFKALGMYPEAIKSYKMVLMLHPKDADARLALDLLEGGVPPAKAQPLPEPEPEKPAPQVFDLTDVGGEEEAAAVEAEGLLDTDEPAVMEMPVPEMETLEQVKKAQAAEPAAPEEAADFGFSAGDNQAAEESGPLTYVIEDEGGFDFAAEGPAEEPEAPAYVIEEDSVPGAGVAGDAFSWGGEGEGAHELAPEVESDIFDMESSPLVMEDEHFETPIIAPAHEYIAPALSPEASDDAFSWGGEGEGAHELAPEVESDVFDMESSPLVMEDEHFETPAPKSAGSGYAIDLGEVKGVKDIFEAYKDDSSAGIEAGENEGVYEIPDDLSAFAMDGFTMTSPKAGPEGFEAAPEPPVKPSKELFETETLAELYISQGFYDRAINIYKGLSVERPDDLTIQQKLQELYQLAHLSATMGEFGMAVDTDKPEPAREEYTPLDFEAAGKAEEAAVMGEEPTAEAVFADEGLAQAGFMESSMAGEDAWQTVAASEWTAAEATGTAGAAQPADPLAAGRLESLLDKIRRKRAT